MLLAGLAMGACDDDAPPEPNETPAVEPGEAEAAPTPTESDPLAGLDDVAALEAETPDVAARPDTSEVDARVPAGGCATFSELPERIWSRAGPTAIASAGGDDGFAFAGYAHPESGSGEELFVGTIKPGGSARPVLREDLERPYTGTRVAPPGLGPLDLGHVGVATTDMAGNVQFAVVQLGGNARPWRNVGSGADRRFPPAVAMRGGRHVVAYTESRGDEGMAVWSVALDPLGEVKARIDLTPANMSAAAPVFIAGSERLFFVDPREGLSVLLSSDVSGDRSAPATTVRPLSNVFEPAVVAPVQLSDTRTVVGFTAMGQAAATAVGLAWVEGEERPAPIPIVPSEGYGALHVSAAALGERVLFVADHATGRERDSSRNLHARLARRENGQWRLSEPLVLAAPDGTGRWGHVAVDEDGTFGVTMTAGDGVYLHWLRCDPGSSDD